MSAKSEGLVLTNVRAGYGETVVIDDVSLSLAPGATLALLGAPTRLLRQHAEASSRPRLC
jgi:ABC-type sugar transport system ATPase subunit